MNGGMPVHTIEVHPASSIFRMGDTDMSLPHLESIDQLKEKAS